MTTPDKCGGPEDLGTVEIFGITFSTFTRSILLGFEELGLPYIHHAFPPHSEEVKKRNPFGLLPVLVHRPDAIYTSPDAVVVLYEANAVRRYVDEALAPALASARTHTHDTKTQAALTPLSISGTETPTALASLRAKVDQYVSVASSNLFQAVEHGVVKPRLAMEKNGATDADVGVALEENLERMYRALEAVEKMANESAGKEEWLVGGRISWADLFLYPALADLRAVKEVSNAPSALHSSLPHLSTHLLLPVRFPLSQGECLHTGPHCRFPWLASWLDRMDGRESVKKTAEGTLASQRKR